MWYLQFLEPAKSFADAQMMLDALRVQVDFRGGRILPAVPGDFDPVRRFDRVQAFFEDVPDAKWLPDGFRRVFVPLNSMKALGVIPS